MPCTRTRFPVPKTAPQHYAPTIMFNCGNCVFRVEGFSLPLLHPSAQIGPALSHQINGYTSKIYLLCEQWRFPCPGLFLTEWVTLTQ